MSTYEEIYLRMKKKYEEKTGIIPDDASDTGLRFSVIASEVYSLLCACDWLKRQMFADTAVGEALDMHAEQRNLTRKTAAAAEGRLTFSVEEAADKRITVPAGTVVSTTGTAPVTFVTEQVCYIEKGAKAVSVNARAVRGGRDGNAPANSIVNIVTDVPYVGAVTNTSAFKGGTDAESDDELRRRVTESYRNISNGTNKAYYKSLCEKIDGVGSVGVVPKNRGTGTVDVFLAAQTTTAGADAVAKANEILKTAREINVDARAFAAKEQTANYLINVRTDGIHDGGEVASACRTAVRELISNAGVGEDILISEIIVRLMEIEGVEDAAVPASYRNTEVNDDSKAVPGTITVTLV